MTKYKADVNKNIDFWRFLRIPEEILVEQAEVGDVILCQSKRKNTLPRASRVSQSNPLIDKIALIVKLQTDI